MDLDNLIHMANRIGAFFEAQPDRDEAMAGIADHLKKFWEPRMRSQLIVALGTPEAEALADIVRSAVERHREMLTPA